MQTLIDFEQLTLQTDAYIDLLSRDKFFEAHEALEKIWFPLRFEKNDEVLLVRAYINAAVSFELVKRGREKSGLKPWGFFSRHCHLIEIMPAKHQAFYEKIHHHIIATKGRVNCFNPSLETSSTS